MSRFDTTVNRYFILQLMGYSDDGNDKPLMGYAHTLAQQLLERDDVATRFVAHSKAIWNAAFPDDPNGWEYGGQLERCVIGTITDLRIEAERLRGALAGLKWATNMSLIKGGHNGWLCPICRAEHRNLSELEAGLHHKDTCEYAEAVKALEGGD